MKALRFRALILLLVAACGNGGNDASGTNGADSTPAPVRDARSGESDPVSAEVVIHDYYAAIAAEDYRQAYSLWGDSGQLSNQTFEQFRTGYQNTASVRVYVGEPGRIEGAAGSRYITIPVQIESVTDAGAVQRYAGTYTLRRVVVDGATESQMRWRIFDAEIAACSTGCADPDSNQVAATQVIERFGRRLRMVSLTGPTAGVVTALREHYGPLLTTELLAGWIEDPAAAAGREVSSPWPSRIEITGVRGDGDHVQVVRGSIVYVTSVDTTSTVDRAPVAIRVMRGGDSRWRISDVSMLR